MLKCESLSLPGTVHLRSGKENEDRIAVLSRKDLTAAVVCDGAGSFGAGAAAAELVSEMLAAYLIKRFDALCTADGEQARLVLLGRIEKTLRAYARRTGTPAQELACTILAAAVHEDGRCLCLHLGDGIILQKNRCEVRPSVVSCPMTGLVPHSTYLTMNCDLNSYLRLYRWQSEETGQLLLLSDGAAEHLVRLRGGDGWVYTDGEPDLCAIRRRLGKCTPRDDHSAVLLSRATE